jgi:hypothetical protein
VPEFSSGPHSIRVSLLDVCFGFIISPSFGIRYDEANFAVVIV